jgi:polar amino acid transport system substrate-binding protein
MRTAATLAAMAAAAALLTACGATGTVVDPAPVASAERPRPVGAEENPTPASGTSTPAPPNCREKASLRPEGLPAPGQMPIGSTMRAIQERGRLIAGVDQNTFLFGFRNPSTNTLEGFDIDRVREIATAIFGNPDAVQYKVISSIERIPALEKGEVDVVVRTMTANCDRWQKINFSTIYYVAGQRLLVDKTSPVDDIAKLANKKVCAQRGSTSIIRIKEKGAVPVATDTWSDCLVMLQQRQVEAVSTDDTILAGLAAQDPNVKLAGQPFSEEPYGIGIPKQNTDMVKFVNAVLERSKNSGDWQRSYDNWIFSRTGQSAQPPPAEYQD